MYDINFISLDNKYELEVIDFDTNEAVIVIDGKLVELTWNGFVNFHRDSDGVGREWVDYDHSVELTVVAVDEEPAPQGFLFNEEWVIEYIAHYYHEKLVNDAQEW